MKHRVISDYNSRQFSFSIDKKTKALIIEFKRWDDLAHSTYPKVLKKYLSAVDPNSYTLVLRCAEFAIPIPYFKKTIKPFLQIYYDAGFKHVRLMTENPQKVLRQVIKEVGSKIGFELEFCDYKYNKQEVYV